MRRREVKWLEMLTQWDAYMLRNYRKVTIITMVITMVIRKMIKVMMIKQQVRERCRKGIPPSIRARAWLHLCGAKYQVGLLVIVITIIIMMMMIIITIIIMLIIILITIITMMTIRWRTQKTVKHSDVCGAAVDVSRGGSMTLRRISTG